MGERYELGAWHQKIITAPLNGSPFGRTFGFGPASRVHARQPRFPYLRNASEENACRTTSRLRVTLAESTDLFLLTIRAGESIPAPFRQQRCNRLLTVIPDIIVGSRNKEQKVKSILSVFFYTTTSINCYIILRS